MIVAVGAAYEIIPLVILFFFLPLCAECKELMVEVNLYIGSRGQAQPEVEAENKFLVLNSCKSMKSLGVAKRRT